MAKSLRSKWKRKMRSIKRERYGKKELEKLKMIVNNAMVKGSSDIEMSDHSEVVKVVSKSKVVLHEEPMEVNQTALNGMSKNNFPVWLGSSKRKKLIKRNRKINKLKKKELKKSLKKQMFRK